MHLDRDGASRIRYRLECDAGAYRQHGTEAVAGFPWQTVKNLQTVQLRRTTPTSRRGRASPDSGENRRVSPDGLPLA
jgi:hypothetical protein